MSSIPEAHVASLIGDVYEAALDPRRWPTVLESMAQTVGSTASTIWMHDFDSSSAHLDGNDGNVAAFLGFQDSALDSFATYYSGVNVWTAAEGALTSGSAVTGTMLVPEHQLRRSEFYNDWLKPQDFFHTLGSIVIKEESRAVKLSFLRPERAGEYGPEELRVMHRLMPHLQSAVATHRRIHRLEVLAEAALGALDGLRFGVLLLDHKGRAMHANAAARDMMARTGAIKLGARGALSAATLAGTGKLQRLIHGAVQTGLGVGAEAGGALRLPYGPNQEVSVFVTAMAARATPFGRGVAAAIFCSDPDGRIGGLVQSLIAVYRMTPAEAALTEALVNGQSVADFAEQRCVTLNTARTQLKGAVAKAGAKRQVDLVRQVLTGPAVFQAGGMAGGPRRR